MASPRFPRLLLLLLLVPLSALPQGASESLEREARSAFRTARFKEAAVKFQDAASATGDMQRRAKMELQAALAHFNDKNTKGIKEALRRALTADPSLEIVGEFYPAEFMRLVDEVRRNLRPAPTPAPIDLAELKRVAEEKLRDGRADEVIYDLRSVPADRMDADLRALLNRAYEVKGIRAGSAATGALPPAGLAPRPGDGADLLAQGRAALARGDNFTAQSAANRALEVEPNSSDAYDLLGDAFLARGDKEMAEANYRQSMKLNEKNEEPVLALADMYLAQKKLDSAVEMLKKAVALDPKHAEKLLSLARRFRAEGDLVHARQVYEAAVATAPSDVSLLTEQAALLIQATDLAAALEPLMKAAVVEPKQAIVHANLAGVLRKKGQAKEAEREYRQALALEPENAAALAGLGAVLLSGGNAGEATSLLEKAAAADPKSIDVALALTRAYRESGRLEEAEKALERVRDADDPGVANEAGTLAYQRGRFGEAVLHFERALAKDPSSAAVKANLERARAAAAFQKELAAKS